jgi:signal transduction histidine kinase/DNA-binding response OmpR family regulator
LKQLAHFITRFCNGISRSLLIRSLILFFLFGGIIFNFFIEQNVHDSVSEHNNANALVIKHEQFKHLIDQTGLLLLKVDRELNRYEHGPSQEVLLKIQELKQSIHLNTNRIKQEGPDYVPRYLINLYIHSIRNRTDMQQNYLSVLQQGKPAQAFSDMYAKEDKYIQLDYSRSERELTSELNKKIEYLNQSLVKDQASTQQLDNRWNMISLLFMLLIAFVVFYQTTRISMLNKELSAAVLQMKEATRAKDQFMSNITHELRTPLNSIIGYTNLLLKKNHQPETEKWLQAVNSSGSLLLEIVNDVLDYSKLESGYLHISKEPFQLDDVLANLKNIMSHRADSKGLSLVILKDQSLPGSFAGDEKKLKQVLINLTGNALKFTEKGSVKVEVALQHQIGEQYWLAFKVTDTGIGISKENLKHIFERFYQVEDRYSRKYSGTGLGLPIVKQLVDMQGGTITVNSTPGAGTEFQFVLPFMKADFIQKEEPNLAPVRRMLQHAGKRILVVDDHELNRELLELVLKEYQCRVVTADSGIEALEILQKMKFDLVLMDVQMPELNGMETTHRIRHQLALDVPVIACTAFSQPQEMQMCKEAGMNDYLGKPVEESQLLGLLKKYLNLEAEPKKEGALINFSKIHSITGANKELTDNMLSRAIAQIPEELEHLQQSLLQKNYLKVKEQSHTMCSTLALLGSSSTLIEQVKNMQRLAGDAAPAHEQLLELFDTVNTTVHKMIVEVKAYLAA